MPVRYHTEVPAREFLVETKGPLLTPVLPFVPFPLGQQPYPGRKARRRPNSGTTSEDAFPRN